MSLSPLREGRITGSRIGAVLGLNPYQSRKKALQEMVRQALGMEPEFTGNEATRHGQAMEPEVLRLYEAHIGAMTYGGGTFMLHPEHDFLAVTPDGLVFDDGMVECKAPFRGVYKHWSQKPYYEAQMRLQLECAGRQWRDFAVLSIDGEFHVSRLEHDPAWLPSIMPKLQKFMADFAAAVENPLALTERKAA